MRHAFFLLAFAAVSACATAPPTAQPTAPATVAFVELEVGGCGFIAACPAYVIRMKPDGSYHYQGYKNVAIIGVRDGQLLASAWADVAKAFDAAGWATLEDPTSRTGGYPCMPDSPFARITRHVRDGEEKIFSYNLGCDSPAGSDLLNAIKRILPMPTTP